MEGTSTVHEKAGHLLEPLQPPEEDAGFSALTSALSQHSAGTPTGRQLVTCCNNGFTFSGLHRPPTTTGSVAALVNYSSLHTWSVEATHTLMTSPLSYAWRVQVEIVAHA